MSDKIKLTTCATSVRLFTQAGELISVTRESTENTEMVMLTITGAKNNSACAILTLEELNLLHNRMTLLVKGF